MVDSINEKLLSLTQAARTLDVVRREGKRPNVATLYRWSTTGCRGVKLDTVQVGGTRCTSREALQRFFEALSAQPKTKPTATAEPLSRPARRSPRRAEALLDRAGIK